MCLATVTKRHKRRELLRWPLVVHLGAGSLGSWSSEFFRISCDGAKARGSGAAAARLGVCSSSTNVPLNGLLLQHNGSARLLAKSGDCCIILSAFLLARLKHCLPYVKGWGFRIVQEYACTAIFVHFLLLIN